MTAREEEPDEGGREDAPLAPAPSAEQVAEWSKSDGPHWWMRPFWVLVLTLASVSLGIAVAGGLVRILLSWYLENCWGERQPSGCDALGRSPPWILVSGLAAGPPAVLVWILRTLHRNIDVRQRDRELSLRNEERRLRGLDLAFQRRREHVREGEFQKQLMLQEKQIDAAAANVTTQIKASAEQQAKQLSAGAAQAERQIKASAEQAERQLAATAQQQVRQLSASGEQQLRQIEANAAQQREQQAAREREQLAQQEAQAAQLKLQQEQAAARADEVKQQIEAGNEANAIARETHLLDTYLRAVKAVGAEDRQEHHAGVVLLGQLGRDSSRYSKAAIEVLVAYIRRYSETPPELGAHAADTPDTVLAALNALAQIPKSSSLMANLRGLAFKAFTLRAGDLSHSDFTGAWLELVDFSDVNLSGASFANSFATKVGLMDCSLRHARFRGCRWTDIEAWNTAFDRSLLWNASIEGQNYGSTFQGARYNEDSHLPFVESGGGTLESEGLTRGRVPPPQPEQPE